MKMSKWTKEQLQAIEKSGCNIIVSAGAGSGKTAVLTERVIEKIKKGIHINELLILTFTKAAASEMKDRIRDKLSKDISYREELNLLNSSYITTFDSFALSVVKKYHYLLNIPKNVSISDDAIVRIKHNQIIDEIFERLYSENNQDFKKLVDKYCVKNDKLLRDLISKIALKIDGFIDKYEYIDNIVNEFYKDENIDKIIDEFYQILEEKKKFVKFELDNMRYYFDSNYMSRVEESIINIMNADVRDLYLFTKVTLPNAPRGSDDEAKKSKNALKLALDELLKFSSYGNIDKIKDNIISNKKIVLVILDIIKIYINMMREYKSQEQIYTFNDISMLAIKIVSEYRDARDELKHSFKEIMIDEYQDTNDVQDTFISYIEDNNVYMVGDVKQSIYRFRGSNPDIFKDKYQRYSVNNGGIKIDLINNFRSRNEVLDNINKIFALIMDYDIGGANYKESHEMVYGNKNYDEEKVKNFKYDIDILEYKNDKESGYSDIELEIFTIANDIKNKINSHMKIFDKKTSKLRDISYNDFVIICDRSKYFNEFKRIFEYLELPLSILKDDNLSSSIDIVIIRNIIDFIIRINNNDFGIEYKYDLLSIARSFLYELDDKYLFNIISNNRLKDNVIYEELSKISSINSKTSAMIFEEILNLTDFYNKLYKIGDYENINVRLKSIYEIANNLSNIGYDLIGFRDYLDNIIENGIDIKYNGYSSNSESIKILTIHKSKGLEYPICYFADLDHKFNLKDANEMFVVSKKYGLIVSNKLEDTTDSILREVFKNDYIKEEISEKIRLFYVALTRAREKLIVVIPYKDTIKYEKNENGVIEEIRRCKFNKLSDLIYAIKDYLPNYFINVDTNKIGLTKNYLYKKKIKENLIPTSKNIIVNEINITNEEISQEHFSKETSTLLSYDNSKNMEYGKLIHEIFELIDMKNFDDSVIKDEFIKNKVNNFLNNELLKNIKESNIYHEYEFIYEKNNVEYHGIIDLMLEYGEYIDIIDFKLKNIVDSQYKKQLNGYKEYIEHISNKKVNIYLYSIIDEEFSQIK